MVLVMNEGDLWLNQLERPSQLISCQSNQTCRQSRQFECHMLGRKVDEEFTESLKNLERGCGRPSVTKQTVSFI